MGFNVKGRDVQSIVKELQQKVNTNIKFPTGYYTTYGGAFENLEKEKEVLSEIQKERADLINFMLDAKNKGMKTQLPKKKENGHYHCDTLGEYCKESHYKYN